MCRRRYRYCVDIEDGREDRGDCRGQTDIRGTVLNIGERRTVCLCEGKILAVQAGTDKTGNTGNVRRTSAGHAGILHNAGTVCILAAEICNIRQLLARVIGPGEIDATADCKRRVEGSSSRTLLFPSHAAAEFYRSSVSIPK